MNDKINRILSIRTRLAKLLDEMEPICEQNQSEDLYDAARQMEAAMGYIKSALYVRPEED